MKWRGAPATELRAIGCRGDYVIRPDKRDRIGWIYRLHAVGHDSLPMLATGPDGRPFPTLTAARAYADKLDDVAFLEPLVSGS